MPFPDHNRGSLFGILVLLNVAAVSSARGAGVTIITHGFNGDIDSWIIPMAQQIPAYVSFPGTNFSCYEMVIANDYSVSQSRIGGVSPLASDSAEIIIKLDWSVVSVDFSTASTDIAAAVVPKLLATNFIPELGGRALAELPIHLVGHSRGGSVVTEMSRLLGTNGVWVDHVTFLDPHPVSFPYGDAAIAVFENVLFADNYWQTNPDFACPNGESVSGAYNRSLTNLSNGYDCNHSDVHLWYHGTIDSRVPTTDTQENLTNSERQNWWTSGESAGAAAGFYFSRMGGGDRLSTNRPAGGNTARVRNGYNQRWDLGAGATNNRISLASNNGNWPNVIKFNLAGTNLMAHGQSNIVSLFGQWVQPATSNAAINIWLDDDFNPFNGNAKLVRQVTASGNSASQISFATNLAIHVNATNATPGAHTLCAEIIGGGRTRYLYAPERLTVVSSFQPPRLTITVTTHATRIEVMGVPGQRVVLQSTTSFPGWQSLVTNRLATNVWSHVDLQPGSASRFYRAVLQHE